MANEPTNVATKAAKVTKDAPKQQDSHSAEPTPTINSLTAIQNELKAKKSKYNSFGKYYYRNVEDIQEALKPLLAKHGSSLFISDQILLIGDRFYIKATAKLTTPDGEFIGEAYAREEETKKGMDASQITGGSSSYARKYALTGLFLIDDGDGDPDSNNDHGKGSSQPQQVAPDKSPALVNAINAIKNLTYDESIKYAEGLPPEVKSTPEFRQAVFAKKPK